MKKIISLLLVALMVFSLAACNNKQTETEPTKDPYETQPPTVDPNEEMEPNVMEPAVKLVFKNEGMQTTILKVELDKAVKNIYKSTVDGDANTAVLDKLVFTFYDSNPIVEVPEDDPTAVPDVNTPPEEELPLIKDLSLTFEKLNYNLLSTDDLQLTWTPAIAGELYETVSGEFVRELYSRYNEPRMTVTGTYTATTGEKSYTQDFEFDAAFTLEERFDAAVVEKQDLKLTANGATLTMDYAALMAKSTLTTAPKAGDTVYVNVLIVDAVTNKVRMGIDAFQIKVTDSMDAAITIEYAYEDALANNKEWFSEMNTTGSYWYAQVLMTVNADALNAEDFCEFTLMVDVTADTEVNPQDTPTQEPTTGETETTEPTDGGNNE